MTEEKTPEEFLRTRAELKGECLVCGRLDMVTHTHALVALAMKGNQAAKIFGEETAKIVVEEAAKDKFWEVTKENVRQETTKKIFDDFDAWYKKWKLNFGDYLNMGHSEYLDIKKKHSKKTGPVNENV